MVKRQGGIMVSIVSLARLFGEDEFAGSVWGGLAATRLH